MSNKVMLRGEFIRSEYTRKERSILIKKLRGFLRDEGKDLRLCNNSRGLYAISSSGPNFKPTFNPVLTPACLNEWAKRTADLLGPSL